ncbi:hypothetical protein V1506DRAFT_526478 [Lipomyces tetrasporus]
MSPLNSMRQIRLFFPSWCLSSCLASDGGQCSCTPLCVSCMDESTSFAIFNVGCAWANSVDTFLACRFLGGFLGCASLVVGGGVISDMFRREEMDCIYPLHTIGVIPY